MRVALLVTFSAGLAACGSCSRAEDGPKGAPSAVTAPSSSAVAEALPRCRGDSQRLALPGEDVVVGDVAIGAAGILAGLVRTDAAGKRVASVLSAPVDLSSSRVVDVGPAFGDDPPPSPRWAAGARFVAYLARQASDGGAKLRTLHLARLEDGSVGRMEATVVQQADESTSFDVAWSEGSGLAAWDEDAPSKDDAGLFRAPDRGFVKVQPLGEPSRPRVASPEASDAEAPRLLARPGGFWLAWIAKRTEDDAHYVEGPGEKRAFRWVEVVALDPRGEAAGPVRRVSSEKGRAVAFELARSGSDLVVIVQDEAAPSEGAGSRIVRHVVGDRIESTDVVDGGVGHSIAEVVPVARSEGAPGEGARWLAWTDTAERARLTPLGSGLAAGGPPTFEPTLDGARVLAAAPPDVVYALVGAAEPSAKPLSRPELRRFLCR